MASRLAIYDLSTGQTETVLTDPDIVEAPNWLPDDSGLVVNKDGRLFVVPFADPRLRPLDTGFAKSCNNDHGISPDGTRLVISDSTEENASCIYILPLEGGAPVRVTERTPSYWHGWSPDGATLAYTAKRGAVFDIHTIPVGGGAETRLTEGFDHTDGPDYSRDGNRIWFNGLRVGSMDLWRMAPDGSDLQRMTRGDSTDWFPHPNPQDDTVLYLAYEPGVAGHPRDHPVALRLYDPATGSDTRLYAMTGGQGSINAPCWAPYGRRFAFVETVDNGGEEA